MKLKTKIKIVKNDKTWTNMRRNLLRSKDNTIDIGWWGGKKHPRTKVPIAQVAKWNEEGHLNGGMFEKTTTPPRPFIRTKFLPVARKLLTDTYAPLVRSIAEGKINWTFLKNRMKEELKMALQEAILEWDNPKNAPMTVQKKGFNDPLIETGTMYDHVRSRVSRRKE